MEEPDSGRADMDAFGVTSSVIEGELVKLGMEGLLVRPLRCEGVK